MKTLWTRLTSETPEFWQRVRLLMVFLAAVLAYASLKFNMVPQGLFDTLTGIFGGIAAISSFATKDIADINAAIQSPAQLLTLAPELIDQIGAIHTAVTNPPPVQAPAVGTLVNDAKAVLIGQQDVPAQTAPQAPAIPQAQVNQ